MPLPSGARLGPYEILSAIGAGGMGEVYKARDSRLGRTVAIKVLPECFAADPERRHRFEQEARAVSAINHPHICVLYDIGHETLTNGEGPAAEGVRMPFLVMEYLDGQTLAQRLRQGPLPLWQVLELGTQIADALATAHDRGVIHRDLKPANIMLTKDGAKLLDFGLAKLRPRCEPAAPGESELPTTSVVTRPGTVMGTVPYMAPEQLTGRETDARTDLFAFGCVLYEMRSGRRAFPGKTDASVIAAIMREPAPTGLQPIDPPALDRIVRRCLAKDPDLRWQRASDVGTELRGLARDPARPGARATAFSAARARWGRRLAAPAIAVLMLAALGWFLAPRWSQPVLAFKERDFIVIADVVNRTGEQAFDLALKSALETDLRQSRYVNVVDSGQVRNALGLMRLAPDAVITPEVGRDLCRRVGAAALLVPRILRVGDAYQVQAALIEPTTGATVNESRVTARGREQVLLSSIDDLTRQVRGRLGESVAAIARTDPPLAQYTTSSLQALQLFAIGQRAREGGDFTKAERSYREALQLDPRFAMARGSLGLILVQFLGQPDEGRKMLAQALEEEGKVSEREYLHLRAVNKQFVQQDLQGALDDYRFISEVYPDLLAPYNNSGRILEQLRRFPEAAAMYDRAHKADPRNQVPLWNLWFLCVGQLKDPGRAEKTARILVSLLPQSASAAHTLAWSLVAERRFAEAEEGMRTTLALDPSNGYALPNLGHLQFRRGAAADAVATYRRVLTLLGEGRLKTDLEHAQLSLGLALSAAGDEGEARETLVEAVGRIRAGSRNRPLPPQQQAIVAWMLAAAGRKEEARLLAEGAARYAKGNTDVSYELARAWALLGDRSRAVRCLEEAWAAGYSNPYFILIDPAFAVLQGDPAIEKLAPRYPAPLQ